MTRGCSPQCDFGARHPGGDFVYRCLLALGHDGEHRCHGDKAHCPSVLPSPRWKRTNWDGDALAQHGYGRC